MIQELPNWFERKRYKLNRKLKEYRYELLRRLFTEDERYLISRAIEDREEMLRKMAVTEKSADHWNTMEDCADYANLQEIFFERIEKRKIRIRDNYWKKR